MNAVSEFKITLTTHNVGFFREKLANLRQYCDLDVHLYQTICINALHHVCTTVPHLEYVRILVDEVDIIDNRFEYPIRELCKGQFLKVLEIIFESGKINFNTANMKKHCLIFIAQNNDTCMLNLFLNNYEYEIDIITAVLISAVQRGADNIIYALIQYFDTLNLVASLVRMNAQCYSNISNALHELYRQDLKMTEEDYKDLLYFLSN